MAASIIACKIVGVKNIHINKALKNYRVKRRLTEKNRALIYDDYAHHPTEILATLELAKNLKNKIIVVFQPHRYTRTKILMKEFISTLSKINHLIILETYSAGEKKIKGATSKDIYSKLPKANKKIIFLENFKKLNEIITEYTFNKNTIIFKGFNIKFSKKIY